MRTLRVTAVTFLLFQVAFAQWQMQQPGVDTELRGLSAVSAKIVWASGSKGTILRTVDGGQHWQKLSTPETQGLDFRDIQGFDANTAYVLSIGPGNQSRIYKTVDGGQHWDLQFSNSNPEAFYDCFAFWDSHHGFALSDSIEGVFPVLSTDDGQSWYVQPSYMPAALAKEGGFAASGTCTAAFGKNDGWFATGGPAARVFHTTDQGETWTVAATPILSGAASQGIFSVAFWSAKEGVAVGGDYQNPKNGERTAAITSDGGRSWKLSEKPPAMYCSAVAVLSGGRSPRLLAVGTAGSSISNDGGRTWSADSQTGFNALSCAEGVCFAAGSRGRIAARSITP